MPWAASQVAWAGPGVLDFLVVPASRRRREAGRHRGLRGPKAIADQVVVCVNSLQVERVVSRKVEATVSRANRLVAAFAGQLKRPAA